MTVLLATTAALLGLLVGSFLNVVVHRVPAGESVVTPRSRCPGCATTIRARDNVPVLSWMALRGRCRDCAAPISARYPLVEVLTAVVFAVLALRLGPDPALPAFLYLGAVGVALAAIDLDTHRLPDALTLPSYAVGAVLLAGAAIVGDDLGALLRAGIGMGALWLCYALLWFVYPAGMGLGDVKLAGVLGLYLGFLGWGALVVGGFAAFLLGGVSGLVLMAVGRAGRKSALPFGPFMLLAALLAIVGGSALAGAYINIVT